MAREYRVGRSAEIDGDSRKVVTIEGREVAVFRHNGRLYAFSNTCLHQGGPVGEGRVFGRVESVIADDGTWRGDRFSSDRIHLVCPWHGWEYDLETGECAGDPQLRLQRYELVERDGYVYVLG